MIVTERDIASLRLVYESRHIAYDHMNRDIFSRPEDVFDGFGYYPAADGRQPGLMVCAVVFAFLRTIPPLSPERTWLAVSHRYAGHMVSERHLIVSVLDVRPTLYSALCRMAASRYPGGDAGWRGRSDPNGLPPYRAALEKIGLWYSGTLLEEGLYPIDATQATLDALCITRTHLADFGSSRSVIEECEPAILVLAENSD